MWTQPRWGQLWWGPCCWKWLASVTHSVGTTGLVLTPPDNRFVSRSLAIAVPQSVTFYVSLKGDVVGHCTCSKWYPFDVIATLVHFLFPLCNLHMYACTYSTYVHTFYTVRNNGTCIVKCVTGQVCILDRCCPLCLCSWSTAVVLSTWSRTTPTNWVPLISRNTRSWVWTSLIQST